MARPMTPADRQFLAEFRTRLEADKARIAAIAASASLGDEQARCLDHIHGALDDAAFYARFALADYPTVFQTLEGIAYLQSNGDVR